jgi:DNA/RNA endonuclease YhcR with UshA esterase domain
MSANTTGDTIYVKESYFKNFIFRTARYYGKDTMAASVKKVIVDYGTGIISTTYLNDFGPVDVGTNSAEQSFTISGTDLSPSRFVRIYPNPGFLISLTSGSGYSSSYIDKSYTSTTLAPTKVFVVFSPLAYNKINSTLKITGATGANDMFVPVSGTGTCGDHTPPRVDSAMAVSSTSVLVYFSEAVDNTAELNNSYLFNPTLTIASVVRSASLKVATITLTTPIAVGTTYTLGVRNVIRDTCINHNVMTTLQTFPIRYGTVKITNHNISEVTSVNATTGQTDSLNVYCRLTGVIQSQNFSQNVNNSMFYIHDNTDGILINRTGAVPVFQVRRGDKVRAMGRIQQVNGLTRLTADSIVVMDSFQQQRTPSVVLKLNESTEAEVNRINNLRLINPLQWPVTAGATRNVQATNGTDTFTITIFTRCNIQGTPAPAGLFDISGLGSQNDNSLPYTTGYTIWPRDLNDLNIHPPYPTYTIAEVHSENAATGFADSAGIYCQLIGVVHGNNESSTGLSFTIIDKTGGIKVFSSVYNGPFYFVTEGDEVAVTGTIQQYNGLTEIYPDTVTLLMPAQTLSTPQPVDNLDESTESKLVQIKNLTIVPPSQWPVSAVNNAVDVEVTDGTHNYLVRINKNCDIQGTPVPVGKFDVTGIGAQFDPTDPFTGQYYIVPRYQADITVSNGISNNDLLNKVNLFPNPSSGSFFIQNGTKISLDVEVFNTTGKLVYRNSSEQQLQKIELPGASGLYLVKITDPKTSISKTFKVELK